MKTPQPETRANAAHPRLRVAGFTIVEMMVSLSVIALMIALLVPLLARTREAAHRLMCATNLRQIGSGLCLYGNVHNDRLPSTIFARGPQPKPQEMISLTTGRPADSSLPAEWDGLGWLIGDTAMFIDSPMALFCPSHQGRHRPEIALKDLASHNLFNRIYSNYHYIGDVDRARDRVRTLATDPSQALVADGMRDPTDINHGDGSNVLRSDGSVQYWSDRHLLMARSLTAVGLGSAQPESVYAAIWAELSRTKD